MNSILRNLGIGALGLRVRAMNAILEPGYSGDMGTMEEKMETIGMI